MEKRVYNFSAGPSMLPLEVLEQAQRELVCYPSAGMSVMEMSHRSKTFENILRETSPQSIHLMNYDIKYFDDKEFLKTITGMLKFAHNNNNGKVELRRCASHLGKSIQLVERILELFEECSFISKRESTCVLHRRFQRY